MSYGLFSFLKILRHGRRSGHHYRQFGEHHLASILSKTQLINSLAESAMMLAKVGDVGGDNALAKRRPAIELCVVVCLGLCSLRMNTVCHLALTFLVSLVLHPCRIFSLEHGRVEHSLL